MTNLTLGNLLINFGHGSKVEKAAVLRANDHMKVYMDLTCFDPSEFYQEHPNLCGSFSALFCNETKKIEVHLKERNPGFNRKMEELGFTLIETSVVSCGFVFPRTIVQIINEAYYALGDKVAEREDINRAMKFGVNYPVGPFEWSEGKEQVVKTLLDELYKKTGDKRYLACPLLDT
ncbi:MAG TPA: 3-hydroxyacyl-CoA dehydrogenase family protein [Bacteriovoracaceae bacterium]|nr:3-hydroxyacyl-CoA dehydrogenase family protein [Bacteriovoracaceae bacterium]